MIAPRSSKVALYADPAFLSSAGIERYTRELIAAVAQHRGRMGFVLFTTREDWAEALRDSVGRGDLAPEVVCRPISRRALRYSWSFLDGPGLERLTGMGVGLAHSPTSLLAPAERCPRVVTVHDLFAFKQPELLSLRQRLVLTRQLLTRAVRGASHIIAISQSTRTDLEELFGVASERISVVPHGVDHELFRPVREESRIDAVRAKYGLPDEYLLYVGSLYARKIGRLVEAYARAVAAGADQRLVLVGGRGQGAGEGEVRRRIRALGLEERVLFPGVVPEADLPVLMSACELFVYVSYYEGFGLSPLEAMACGAPVVVSRVSSLPEVVGDAGLLVDPYDDDAIAGAILSVLADGELRARLRRLSLEQAAKFSWERTARATLALYEELLGGA